MTTANPPTGYTPIADTGMRVAHAAAAMLLVMTAFFAFAAAVIEAPVVAAMTVNSSVELVVEQVLPAETVPMASFFMTGVLFSLMLLAVAFITINQSTRARRQLDQLLGFFALDRLHRWKHRGYLEMNTAYENTGFDDTGQRRRIAPMNPSELETAAHRPLAHSSRE